MWPPTEVVLIETAERCFPQTAEEGRTTEKGNVDLRIPRFGYTGRTRFGTLYRRRGDHKSRYTVHSLHISKLLEEGSFMLLLTKR